MYDLNRSAWRLPLVYSFKCGDHDKVDSADMLALLCVQAFERLGPSLSDIVHEKNSLCLTEEFVASFVVEALGILSRFHGMG